MEIREVGLLEGGKKGIRVSFLSESNRDALRFKDKHKSEFVAPVHKELALAFKKLKCHLLKLTGYWRDSYDAYFDYDNHVVKDAAAQESNYVELLNLIASVKVTSVSIGKEIQLRGSLKVQNKRAIRIEAMPVKHIDDYEDYDILDSLVHNVRLETEKHINGSEAIKPKQFLLEFNEDNPEESIDVDAIGKLPDEEAKAKMIEILETRYGSIVIDTNDVSMSGSTAPKKKEKEDAPVKKGGKKEKVAAEPDDAF